ncbi:Phosphopentomutase [Bienertia sinuspersici]
MAGRLGRRVVHFANLPIKLLMPSSFSNITEISLKTIPSASKIEIKRVLESLYGKLTLPLKTPLSISPDLFPIKVIQDDKKELDRKTKTSIVEDENRKRSHWLDGSGVRVDKTLLVIVVALVLLMRLPNSLGLA